MGAPPDDKKEKLLAEFLEHERAIQALYQAGEDDLAFKRYKSIVSRFGNLPQFCLSYGNAFQRRKYLRDAIEWYERAIKMGGRAAEYYLTLAHAYSETEDGKDNEITTLWEGFENATNPLVLCGRLERLLIESGNRYEVFRFVDAVKQRHKQSPELLYLQAEAAHVMDLYPTTVELLRRSQKAGHIGPRHYFLLGDCFSYFGLEDLAIRFYLRQLDSNGPKIDSFKNMYEIIKWRKRPGDDRLITSIHWHYLNSAPERGLESRVQLRYLDADVSPESYASIFQTFKESLLGREGEEYDRYLEINDQTSFAAFYLELLLNHPNHGSATFRTLTSLKECAERIAELSKGSDAAAYFNMWVRIYQEEYDRAAELYNELERGEWRPIFPGQPPGELSRAKEMLDKALLDRGDRSKSFPLPTRAIEKGSLTDFGSDLTAELHQTKREPPISLTDGAVNKLLHALRSAGPLCLILTGPPGVGKSEAVRALAYRVGDASAPDWVKGFSVHVSSTNHLLAGAGILGTWQDRVIELGNTISLENKRLLFLEDIQNIFGAGRSIGDKSRFADMLLPMIESRKIAIIGELNHRQLEDLRTREPQFGRLVTEIAIQEPPQERLREIMTLWAQSTTVGPLKFTREALQRILDLGRTFLPYKAFPGKAREILDDVLNAYSTDDGTPMTIGSSEVTRAFCWKTGIPEFIVDENIRLDRTRLEAFFAERVLGQERAIQPVTDAVVSLKARLNDPGRPIRSFLFVGPTGVGKTETAKVLAEYVFGDRGRIIRLNMSEYSDGRAVHKLIGAPNDLNPQAGHFMAEVRRTPFSIVLLDEIEKADSDVFHLLLQILDEGVLQDELGAPAYFQTTFVIMTSNLGARRYSERSIGFSGGDELGELQRNVMKDVQEFFSPEVLNRIDEVVYFTPLDEPAIRKIINREVGKLLDRQGIIGRGIQVEVDPLVLDYIMQSGYDSRYGARHIKRAVERCVATPLAQVMASRTVPEGSLIRINLKSGLPIADLILAEDWLVPSALRDRQDSVQAALPSLSDQALKGVANALANRVESLKQKLRYDELTKERDTLQKDMLRPGFWDSPGTANESLRRFAAVNRRTERIHKWEDLCARIDALAKTAGGRQSTAEKARIRSQVLGLTKDLESAELEILLEGKYDSADALLLITTEDDSRDHVKWVHDMAGVYQNWARRRGYQIRPVGEAFASEKTAYGVIFHIGGLNAFGLLKSERGIHRKTTEALEGKSKNRKVIDCQVITLADVQPLADTRQGATIAIQKLKKNISGHLFRQLSRSITLQGERNGVRVTFLADSSVDKDGDLPREFYLSYLHYLQKRQQDTKVHHEGVWGSLVRTYFAGKQNRIVDHASKIVMDDVKAYFGGKIDTILLERIL